MKRFLRSLVGLKKKDVAVKDKIGEEYTLTRSPEEPMLVNVNQSGGRKYSEAGTNVYPPPKKQIKRENSRTSIKSARSTTSTASHLQKRIEEHKLKNDTAEWQKEQEYNIRRKRKKELRKIRESKTMLKFVKKLYVLAILGMVLGTVMIFGSTIRTIGDGSMFWTHKEAFKIIGPIVIVIGMLLLFTAIAIETKTLAELKEAGEIDIHAVIHPDFKLERRREFERLDSEVSATSLYNSNDDSRLEQRRQKWYETQLSSGGEDEFLNSSIASSCSIPHNYSTTDLTTRWAKAMSMNIDSSDSANKSHDNTSDTLTRVDSALLRSLHNTPSIQVIDVDECSKQMSTSEHLASKSSSLGSLKQTKPTEHDFAQCKLLVDTRRRGDASHHRNGFVMDIDSKLKGISEESVSLIGKNS